MDDTNLTLEDCMCSICMCIYVEPVTMPCTHTLCMPCFKQNVEATSLTCPLCRKRISTWARHAARDKTLVNDALWKKIQSMFPDKVEKRLEGDEEDEADINVFQPIINIAQPGEIRREYEEQLKRLEKERELERQREQEASEALIRQLEEEGKMKSVAQQLIEERDQELAKELENVVNEAGTDSPFNLLLKESRERLTRGRATSATGSSESHSPATIESFLEKMRKAEKLKEADRSSRNSLDSPYPYKCFTPSDKDDFSRPSTITVSSRTSIKSSASCLSHSTDANNECEIMTKKPDYLLKQTSDEPDICGTPKKLGSMTIVSTPSGRSLSSQSPDSIDQELNHFKPIRSCPLTPPRKLASGKIVEAQIIRTTPRNLYRMDSFSPTASKSLSNIDAGSPIMQRRLSELDEERKSQVKQNSKSTETIDNSSNKTHGITKYFSKPVKEKDKSPSENIPNSNMGSEDNIPLKKLVIPLEPIFDDVKNFDDVMAPLMEINNIQKGRSDKEKSLKARQRKISKQENVNNNSFQRPQRSIKDWLAQTKSSSQGFTNDFNICESSNNQEMEIDSKDGILELNINQSNYNNTNKLKLKKYPKRKHAAYHISDYVYPQISPKKKRITCIEISSDEEDNMDTNESLDESAEQIRTNFDLLSSKRLQSEISDIKGSVNILNKRSKNVALQRKGARKLKTLKQTQKAQQVYLKPKNMKTSTESRCLVDDVFKTSSVDKLKQEEADRQLAMELEKLFKLEEKSKISAIRLKGSDNEYNFRRKSRIVS